MYIAFINKIINKVSLKKSTEMIAWIKFLNSSNTPNSLDYFIITFINFF